jgi:hypothetical protein
MFRCGRCNQRTFCGVLEHRIHKWECRWPSGSHVEPHWELREVPYCAAQLERYGKHCRDILLRVSQRPVIHTMAGCCAEIRLFVVSDRCVCTLLRYAS